ncbi:GlmU family protein [Adhaeribacter sp. BT258]|uniref:GlmU family protein n=1 Tax=Adhaeribacter terrigena TaxID=2793070 RepID=A0ABS1BWT5_9BACT|nr:GlmU family protein [Adhaeribacter terrigena]MBK0401520.1 GlmU family protein [Adhaeribacter terrigena]
MNLILFDEPEIRQNLLPFTFTRPVADIRVGILTLAEKWAHVAKQPVSFLTERYLQAKFPANTTQANIYVNGAVFPDTFLAAEIAALTPGEALMREGRLVALHAGSEFFGSSQHVYDHVPTTRRELPEPHVVLQNVWEIFAFNGAQIRADFKMITHGRKSQPVNDRHTFVYGEENIFIEEGVKIRAAVLNAESGPIYLGKNSEIQEGSLIKGPFALCEGSTVNMGAKMRGDNTVGPHCKVGGEISNSVIFAHSNKGHDGFLGNSVIGEWCNLGADTNTSNLKNNYADVKLWNHAKGGFKNTGLQFCGLMMGDHSKCGINTMFNTGTVTGVSANIFGSGFPRNFIPSFAWGGASGFETYQLRKVFEVAEKVMARRNKAFDQVEKDILTHVFEETAASRNF